MGGIEAASDVFHMDPFPFEEGEDWTSTERVRGVLAMEMDSVRPPEPANLEDLWQARAEILAIREPRVEERLDAQPRRVVTRPETPEPVADIFPPQLETPGDNFQQALGGLSGADFFDAVRRDADVPAGGAARLEDLPLPPASDSDGDWGPSLRPAALGDAGGHEAFFEHRAELADQLLRIAAQTYLDPVRPEYRYFKLQLRPSDLEALPVLPREVIFLLDASSRVSAEAFRQVSQAVGAVLGELRAEDRFNLYLLQGEVIRLFDESQPATPIHVARARGRLAQTRPQGRGEIFAGLNMLLEAQKDPKRVRIAVLVTDGVPSMSLEDSSASIERFTRQNQGEISVFTVGIGRQVNRYLLDFLSFQNRGDSLVTEQTVQIPDALQRVMRGIRRPVLRHLSYRFADGESLWVYPASLTHLYLDRPLILVGRLPAEQQTLTFQIVGNSADNAQDMLYTLDVGRIPPGPWSLRQDWAWQSVLDHVNRYLRDRDGVIRGRIEALSRNYGISVPYTLSP